MSVTDDVALGVDLLGRCIVIRLSINEIASLKVIDGHLDGEGSVGSEVLTIHRRLEFGTRHICRRSDDTHWSRVARARLDLLAICDGFVNGEAKVDKVIGRSERGNLASGGIFLSVALETCSENLRIESQRRLGVAVVSSASRIIVSIASRIIVSPVVSPGVVSPLVIGPLVVVPLSLVRGGSESLTGKEGDSDQSSESSRELHCVGCSENEKGMASQKLGGKDC